MKLFGILLIAFGFTQCGSLKLEKNPPFEIKSAKYQNMVGGMPGSSGIIVTISYESTKQITFDSIYFSKSVSKLQPSEYKGKKSLGATMYSSVSSGKKDLILDSDSKKELMNEIPKLKKIPFELEENEAVISYKIGEKTKYFKIENLKKGQNIIRQ